MDSKPPVSAESVKGNPFRRMRYTDFLFNHPYIVVIVVFVVSLAFCGSIFAVSFQWTNVGNFYPRNTADAIDSDILIQLGKETSLTVDAIPEQTSVSQTMGFLFLPPVADQPNGNVLVPSVLKHLYNFNKLFVDDASYKSWCLVKKSTNGSEVDFDAGDECRPMDSIIQYADFGFDDEGNTTQDKINDAIDLIVQFAPAAVVDGFLGKSFDPDARTSNVTIAVVSVGKPFQGFEHPLQRQDGCNPEDPPNICPYATVDGKNQFQLENEYLDPFLDKVEKFAQDASSDTEILFGDGTIGLLFGDRQVVADILLVNISTAIVIVLVTIFAGSFFLAFFGVLQVYMSFPLTLAAYLVVFRFEVMTNLNLLSLFILIAIGADGILVFLDAWKQATVEFPELSNAPRARMAWTFRRSVSAILATSMTTAVAFYAANISVLPSIKVLSIFIGTCVVFNFLLLISVFPALVAIWYRNEWDKRWPWQPQTRIITADEELIPYTHDARLKNIEEYRFLERMYFSYISPALVKWRFLFIIVAVALAGVMLGFATQIQPMQDNADFFPEDFLIVRYATIATEDFAQTSFQKSYVVWGVDSLDRSGIDINDEREVGTLVYDESFDLTTEVSQLFVIAVCNNTSKSQYKHLVHQQGSDEVQVSQVRCFMSQFRDWCGENSAVNGSPYDCGGFPVAADRLAAALQVFLDDPLPPHGGQQTSRPELFVSSDVGIENGAIQWAVIAYNTSIPSGATVADFREPRKDWQQFEDEINAAAPSGVDKAFQSVPGSWPFILTVNNLISGAFIGCGLSMGLAFIIILALTQNLIIAAFSTLSIASTVFSTLGMIFLLGWDLEIVESISIQVLVGLAVDYVLHLAIAYHHQKDDPRLSNQENRAAKIESALTELGISLIGGLATTAASTGLLFAAQLLLLQRFGQIVLSSILFSFFFSHTLFVPLMAWLGPVGDQGDILAMCGLRRTGRSRKIAPDMEEVQEEPVIPVAVDKGGDESGEMKTRDI